MMIYLPLLHMKHLRHLSYLNQTMVSGEKKMTYIMLTPCKNFSNFTICIPSLNWELFEWTLALKITRVWGFWRKILSWKKVQSDQKCWQLLSSMEITTRMLLLTSNTFGQAVRVILSLSSGRKSWAIIGTYFEMRYRMTRTTMVTRSAVPWLWDEGNRLEDADCWGPGSENIFDF